MRACCLLVVLLALVGCKKPREAVIIDGVSATVPGDWVPMSPERVEKLREAAQNADPNVEVAMVGRRPPDRPMPWMYLQRNAMRPLVQRALPARAVLDGTMKELRDALTESGLEVTSATSSALPDAQESCFVTKSKKQPPVLNHTCLRMWVGKTSKKVHTVSVVCLATEGSDDECERVTASRVFTTSDTTPLDQPLEPW